MTAQHWLPSSWGDGADYAPAHFRVAIPPERQSCRNFRATTQIARWTGNDIAVVIDVTVNFDVVGFCPSDPGHWQCEPADREPPRRSEYTFAFTGASPDDPDETPLTGPEMVQLAAWFDQHHDSATEHTADHLRDLEV